jgi:shikimate dehydrogenase
MNCLYQPYDVRPEDLRKFVESVKILGIAGFNVTIPHKLRIMRFLDDLDKSAHSVGAANLVVNRKGKLIGYNADSYGIKATIEDYLKFPIGHRRVLLIGAGGAARAAIEYFRKARPGLVVLSNRNQNRAKKLRRISGMKNTKIVDPAGLAGYIENPGIDLVINATPVATASFLNSTPSGLRIFDMSYKSGESPYGKSRIRCDGKYMLAAQASRGIWILCGIKIAVDEIFNLIRRR